MESRKATISLDALECSVCYNIPSPTTMILCLNGHVVCNKCRTRLSKCGFCKSEFKNEPFSNVLHKLLDSVQFECEFANVGCLQKVNLSDRHVHEIECKFRNKCKYFEDGCNQNVEQNMAEHEETCYFRPIYCFNRRIVNCQDGEIKDRVAFQIPGIISHIQDAHDYPNIRRVTIDNLTTFELSDVNLLKEIFAFYYQGKLAYIFVPGFGLDELNDCLKACLISTDVPDEIAKWNCTMTFKARGIEILNYTGKVFSIDETLDIHSIQARGLIYPESLQDKFKSEEATFSFSLFQIQNLHK